MFARKHSSIRRHAAILVPRTIYRFVTAYGALVTLLAAAMVVAASVPCQAQTTDAETIHAEFSSLLGKFVNAGRVDYRGLSREREQLGSYLQRLETVDVDDLKGWPAPSRLAFWINAYNAYTLLLILDHYPIDSIWNVTPFWKRPLGGPFAIRYIPLGDLAPELELELLSLNDVEHQILRKQYREPRIHAAIVCASKGCPVLQPTAYVGNRLEAQLDSAMREFLADRRKNRYEAASATLRVSPIFKWFADDFASGGGPVGYFRRYGPAAEVAQIESGTRAPAVRYTDYDWSLNE